MQEADIRAFYFLFQLARVIAKFIAQLFHNV
jgi:hypothetical protein